MPAHPPWLRFQAYVVGLPKTGSTSVATMLGTYRSAHEWRLNDLVQMGLQWRDGSLDADGFWKAAAGRLDPAALEMDSATVHHLYADLLAERYPRALFVHTVRDVRSWVTSLLDMILRKQVARSMVHIESTAWEQAFFAHATGGLRAPDATRPERDEAVLIPLMRFWSDHMRELPQRVPSERTLVVRTADLAQRWEELAAFLGIPPTSMRLDLTHANRAPFTLDRMAAFDSPELRVAYDEHCAELMDRHFPREHARWSSGVSHPEADWDAYLASVRSWVSDAVAQYGPQAAR